MENIIFYYTVRPDVMMLSSSNRKVKTEIVHAVRPNEEEWLKTP